MKERIRFGKPNDEGHTFEEEEVSPLTELQELTQNDVEILQNTIQNLKKEFDTVPTIGSTASVEGLYNRARREFVVPLVSAEQKERLLDNLTNLGVYPWEDNGMLIIDHRKDLEKLRLAGFIAPEIEPQPPFKPTYIPTPENSGVHEKTAPQPEQPLIVDPQIKELLEKLTKRVRPDSHAFPYPETRGKSDPVRIARGQDSHSSRELSEGEPMELDEEIRAMIDAFEAGDPDVIDSPQFRDRFGDLPTLTLFPQKKIFVNGEMFDKHTGAHISKAERAETLARAKLGDARAIDEVVRSNIGLVLKSYGRVWEKQGGSDLQPDDLFQEALIGLATSIKKHDPELGGFSTYAVLSMEQKMRRFIQEKRRVIHLPAHTSQIRARYTKLKRPLEQAGKLDKRALAASLSEHEMVYSPTESALDRFERTYYINSTFSPFEEAFENTQNTEVTLQALPLAIEVPRSIAENTQREDRVQEAFSNLRGKEALILRMRFGITTKERVDLRELVADSFYFQVSDEVVAGESTEDLLKRARSVVEDKRGQTSRTLRYVELLEKAYEVRERELTDEELSAYDPVERLFFAAYGCMTEEQIQKFPIAQDATLEEVGALYGSARERIRQIEAKAIRHLRHPAYSKKLSQMLP